MRIGSPPCVGVHGPKRIELPRLRESLDELNELALEEEPSYLDFIAYIVEQEVIAREQTQRQKGLRQLVSRSCVPWTASTVASIPRSAARPSST
jgi:hypothetical protein